VNHFIAKYQKQLNGVLSGFDRIVFRGTLGLNHEAGLKGYCKRLLRLDRGEEPGAKCGYCPTNRGNRRGLRAFCGAGVHARAPASRPVQGRFGNRPQAWRPAPPGLVAAMPRCAMLLVA